MLTTVEHKLEHAKNHIMEVFLQSCMTQYGKSNGSYDIERFKKDLAIAVALKSSADASMS